MARVYFLTGLLLLQLLTYRSFIKYLKTTKIYKPSYRFYSAIPFILFIVPFIAISLISGRDFNPPDWLKLYFMPPFYIWMGATFFISLWLLIGKVIKLPFKLPIWLMKIFKPLREKIHSLSEKKHVRKVNHSRRQFVKYATFAASSYAFIGAGYGVLKHDSFEIIKKNIQIDNLPPELKGTTITLISDIHAGQYMNEKDMREYADVLNELNSDIICIPGDFVNYQRDDVHSVAAAFRNLKAKHGIYGTLGNHDFFQDGNYVADVMNSDSPVKMMRNSHVRINIKGKDLFMIGIDDTISSGAKMETVLGFYNDMESYLYKKEETFTDSPKILLCHKPYGFDYLATKNLDLVLSGHTHGGQVVPFKMGNINISFAATISKYIEGHYKIGKANMYVSRGIGSVALPIRINCPPEVTQITLV